MMLQNPETIIKLLTFTRHIDLIENGTISCQIKYEIILIVIFYLPLNYFSFFVSFMTKEIFMNLGGAGD
jgi:hypothetical protein